MALGGKVQVSENTSPLMDQNLSSFTSLTGTNNTNWETTDMHISVAEDTIRKATGRLNTPLECWGCTISPIYHAERFYTYRNCPNERDPDVTEREKQSI